MPKRNGDFAFILDFFGVVASFDNDVVYERLSKHCRDKARAFQQMRGREFLAARDIITGRMTLPQIHRRIVDDYGLSLDYDAFRFAWLEPYSRPMSGMADLIEILASDYKLLILSNIDRFYWDAIQGSHPELQCFDAVLLSCNLGMAKPDRAMFLHAAGVAGIEPSRCFFIDDTLANVDAARSVGFKTHWFKTVSGLVEDLRERKLVELENRIAH
jgi:HAD superfamily hydrolase (TIGR01509 family)